MEDAVAGLVLPKSANLIIGGSRHKVPEEDLAWIASCEALTQELEAFKHYLHALPSILPDEPVQSPQIASAELPRTAQNVGRDAHVSMTGVASDDEKSAIANVWREVTDKSWMGDDEEVDESPETLESAWENEIAKYMRMTENPGQSSAQPRPDEEEMLRAKLHQIWDEELWKEEKSSKVGSPSTFRTLRKQGARRKDRGGKEKKETIQQLERYKRQLTNVQKKCKAARKTGVQKEHQFLEQVQHDLQKYDSWGKIELKMSAIALVKLRISRYQILQQIELHKAKLMNDKLSETINLLVLLKGNDLVEVPKAFFLDPMIMVEQDYAIARCRKINLKLDAFKSEVAREFFSRKTEATMETEETRKQVMIRVVQGTVILDPDTQYHDPLAPSQDLFNSVIYDQRFRTGERLRRLVKFLRDAQVLDSQQESGDVQWEPRDIIDFCITTADEVIEEHDLERAPSFSREVVELYVNRAVFALVYDHCYARGSSDQKENDARCLAQLQWLSDVTFDQLKISAAFCRLEENETTHSLYRRAIDRLNDIMFYLTPSDIIYCIKDAFGLLNHEAVRRSGEVSLGADELIPLFEYCVIHARLPDIHEILTFVMNFGSSNEKNMGQRGWCLTTFAASVAHITNDLREVDVRGHVIDPLE